MIIAVVENRTIVVVVNTFAASIAAKEIERHFDALTHFPDRRADSELAGLADRLNEFALYATALFAKGGCAGGFDHANEIEAFARRHVGLTRRYWLSEGRCMNWFITGPSRFPVARNEKRMRVAEARRAEIAAHAAAARKAVKRVAFPYGVDGEPIRSGDPAAVERIAAKINDLALSIGQMKAANALIRRMEKQGATDEAMVSAVVQETDMTAETAMRGVVLAHWQTRRGFDTTNSRAEMRRLQARLQSVANMQDRGTQSREIETEAGAVEIRENAEIARVQLLFPGKPDEQTRRSLKAHGFRWSPSQGAWQRHLNEAGRYAAQRVLKSINDGGASQ